MGNGLVSHKNCYQNCYVDDESVQISSESDLKDDNENEPQENLLPLEIEAEIDYTTDREDQDRSVGSYDSYRHDIDEQEEDSDSLKMHYKSTLELPGKDTPRTFTKPPTRTRNSTSRSNWAEYQEETLIKFGFEPDFLRGLFWALFLGLLLIGRILTDFLSSVDYEDNPIKRTFGTNNPCLWLDYPPSTYVTPSIWVITCHIYLWYCLFRWYRTTVAYRDTYARDIPDWEYKVYTFSIWVEAATVVFFSTVFSIGPEEDMPTHTLPYSIVSIGACLNVCSDFWYLTRIAGRRDWFWKFELCYTICVVCFTFFKVHSELVVVGGPLDPYPFGVQGPWIFLVIPCEMFISMISGKHTKDMQVTIAIPRNAHEWSIANQEAEHDSMTNLLNEPVFCWILQTLVFVLYFIIYPGEQECVKITKFGPWAGCRYFIYCVTIIIFAAGCAIYYKANCFCLSRDLKNDLKLWHQVDIVDDCNPSHQYTKSTIARLKKPVRPSQEEWWKDRLLETEDYLIKPLFIFLLLKFLFLTLQRVGSQKNTASGNGMVGLCTLGQACFFVYFINFINAMKTEDRGEQFLMWWKVKLYHGYILCGWCALVTFIRIIAAFTGKFEANYYGREC